LENWKEVNCEAQPTSSHLVELIGEGKELDVVKLRISGTINSYDMMVMRNKMQNLRELDLTNATIVANSFNSEGIGVSQDNVFSDFMKGKSLTNILLPASITSIGNGALQYCNNIQSVTIPENVISIGDNAFYGCKAISSVNVPVNSKLQSIGSYAFSNMSRLTTIDLSNATQLKTLGEYAFYSSALESFSSAVNISD
jgi:hypothetical protein